MNLISYEYEGNAEIKCLNSGECYQVDFTGSTNTTIEDAIKESLEEEGWEGNCCPQCVEVEEEDGDDYNSDPDS